MPAYTYDANGNTIQVTVDDITSQMTYSNRNERLTYTDDEISASYEYGSDGLRTKKTVDGITTEYIWSGGNIVAEIMQDKTIVYFYGLNRISRTIYGSGYNFESEDDDGNTAEVIGHCEIYLYDGHGNVAQLVGEDSVDNNSFVAMKIAFYAKTSHMRKGIPD